MATIDKLTLQLDAEGIKEFVKSMSDAEKSIKTVKDSIKHIAAQNGVADKSFERSNKKVARTKRKAEKEQQKGFKLFNENFKQSAKSLDKMAKVLLTLGGISFGVSGLINKSAQAAKTSTDLANRSRNSAATAQQLEALDTATKAEGRDGALNNFADKLSQNYLAIKSGGTAANQDIIKAINWLNNQGASIDYQNTDPINTIKEMNKFLLSVPKSDRAGLLEKAGFSKEEGEVLSSDTLSANIATAMAKAIQTPERVEAGGRNQAALTFSSKSVENQWLETGEKFTPVVIAMNRIAATILKEVNKLEPLIEAAMPKLEKIFDNILKWADKFITGFISDEEEPQAKSTGNKDVDSFFGSTGINKSISSDVLALNEQIKSIDKKSGTIFLKDGSTYKTDSFNFRKVYEREYFDYLLSNNSTDAVMPDINDGKYQPASQIMGQQYANQNNSQSQVISINEMHIRTDANNVTAIVNDGIRQSNAIVGSATNLAPYLPNTK